jgi:3-methyl-2-oxobutanoate hydroxymethyltransferase
MSETLKHVRVTDVVARKAAGEKVTMLTAYDFPTAKLVDDAGVDVILVGDSLGQEELGYDSTLPVTMEEMLHHVKAVRRGTKRSLLLADLPFLSYQISESEALRNAGRLVQEGGANAVKLEGGSEYAPLVRRLVLAGIPVVGHMGLTPQYQNVLGGMRVAGRSEADAARLRADALALQEAGAFAVVLELVPRMLAAEISRSLVIPTVGIGSGPGCDGQVLVTWDLIGLRIRKTRFRHSRRYADVGEIIVNAVTQYRDDVLSGAFPTIENSID